MCADARIDYCSRGSQMFGVSTIVLPYLLFETVSLTESGAQCLGVMDGKASGAIFPCLPSTGGTDMHPSACLLLGAGDPNSGPHACAASTLQNHRVTTRVQNL